MNKQGKLSPIQRQILITLGIIAVISFIIVREVGLVLSEGENSTQDIAVQSPQQEREIEDKIPKHLPIKVKVKNLDKVKKLDNEKWARDIEIEVTNTSDKPIYFLDLELILPQIKSSDGYEITMPLRYGRMDLISFTTPIKPEDIPIQPGESFVFKIPQQDAGGWAILAAKRNILRTEPKKLGLEFYILNFGDGTGFRRVDGKPIDIHKKQSFNSSCGQQKAQIATVSNAPPNRTSNSFIHLSFSFLPASFLPVNF